MQKLFLEEDDENDDGEDPDSMETVVGLLQSAIVINTSGSNFNWRLNYIITGSTPLTPKE